MRPCRSVLALAALLLAFALAACSGDAATPEATSTPAPTATATPEATSTPAPTAIPTPEATSTPEATAIATPEATPTPEAASTPEQACANGVAVAEPEAHPGLVADCEMLLRAKDALRGDASLDWGGGLAVEDWEGVAVSGEPPRVTGLDLRGKGLTRSIPRELRRLRLNEVRLGGNALTGCVPSAFEDASGDAASLGLPWCLRYDRLDATGEAASAGEWAILGGSGEALTTWEQLRSEAATLRVHQTDAGGNSWASEFGAVAVNDLFEWRKTDDCWVRYRVTGAPAAPSGASGRWEFPVEWITYAATGAGCTGAVGSSTVLRVDEEPASIQSPYIESPVRHGPYLLYPPGWTSAIEEPAALPRPAAFTTNPTPTVTTDIAAARQLPLWQDPVLPEGWTFLRAEASTANSSAYGYKAYYLNALGEAGIEIYAGYLTKTFTQVLAYGDNWLWIREARIIDGRPGRIEYASPIGRDYLPTRVTIYDTDNSGSGFYYHAVGRDQSMSGRNVAAVIEVVRNLLHRRTTPTP